MNNKNGLIKTISSFSFGSFAYWYLCVQFFLITKGKVLYSSTRSEQPSTRHRCTPQGTMTPYKDADFGSPMWDRGAEGLHVRLRLRSLGDVLDAHVSYLYRYALYTNAPSVRPRGTWLLALLTRRGGGGV